MRKALIKTFGIGTLALACGLPVAAQSTPGATGPTATGQGTTTTDRDEGGFDLGWLGLIGLVGLAGLRRRVDASRR